MTALALLMALMAQDADMPALSGPVRPMIECSEHLNDDRALRNCMEDLLRDAEAALADALSAARTEAREIDLDMPGMAHATARLDAAHTAWIAYRDAECDRRASLLMIGDNAANVGIDCRVSLTRSRTRELIEQ